MKLRDAQEMTNSNISLYIMVIIIIQPVGASALREDDCLRPRLRGANPFFDCCGGFLSAPGFLNETHNEINGDLTEYLSRDKDGLTELHAASDPRVSAVFLSVYKDGEAGAEDHDRVKEGAVQG